MHQRLGFTCDQITRTCARRAVERKEAVRLVIHEDLNDGQWVIDMKKHCTYNDIPESSTFIELSMSLLEIRIQE